VVHDIPAYSVKTPRKKTLPTQARMMHLFYGGFNFTETNSTGAGIGKFVHDRSLFLQMWSWASDQGNNVLEWLKQPREQLPEWIGQNERWLTRCRCAGTYHGMVDHLYGRASAVVCIGLQPYWHWRRYDFLGWRDQHIIIFVLVFLGRKADPYATGTLAAAFQSFAYGGFTPAGGIFATLTSMGMLGVLRPLEVGLAAVSATGIAIIVWACGVGR